MLNKKTMYGFLILLIGVAMSINTAVAQVTDDPATGSQLSFSAIVVDASTGEPIPDVAVKVKGTDQEATTDQSGMFTFDNLNVPVGTSSVPGSVDGEGITFEINHEGYKPFSKTLTADEIRQSQQGQGQMGEEQAQQPELMRFELEPEEGQY